MSRLALGEAIDFGDKLAPQDGDKDSINEAYLKALRRAYINASRYMLKHRVDLYAEDMPALDENELIDQFDLSAP